MPLASLLRRLENKILGKWVDGLLGGLHGDYCVSDSGVAQMLYVRPSAVSRLFNDTPLVMYGEGLHREKRPPLLSARGMWPVPPQQPNMYWTMILNKKRHKTAYQRRALSDGAALRQSREIVEVDPATAAARATRSACAGTSRVPMRVARSPPTSDAGGPATE